MYQLRIKYQKIDQLKFISHLELKRVVERAFRRMELPLKFSQGFNPQPKINFAAPLSVGVSSDAEYVDVELLEKIDIKEMFEKSKSELPKGLNFLEARYTESKKSLMSVTAYSLYAVNVKSDARDEDYLKKQIQNFLSRDEILHTKLNKKNKEVTKNIRDLILDIQLITLLDESIVFKTFLKTGSAGNLKPETVLEHFMELEKVNLDMKSVRIHRLELYADNNGKPMDILDVK